MGDVVLDKAGAQGSRTYFLKLAWQDLANESGLTTRDQVKLAWLTPHNWGLACPRRQRLGLLSEPCGQWIIRWLWATVAGPVRDRAKTSTPAYKNENAWSDLGLTLPLFIGYHLCVVFLPIHNAADWVTHQLAELASNDLRVYVGLTLMLGMALVATLMALGRGHTLRMARFVGIIVESMVYAVLLRVVASAVVGRLRLDGAPTSAIEAVSAGPFAGIVLSMGAGFYEELAFRVGLFAVLGRLVWLAFVATPLPFFKWMFWLGWAVFAAAVFSAWHHVGRFGEPFSLQAFVFRWVSGLVFTAIFAFRGFAPAVWTHALYDIWVLVI